MNMHAVLANPAHLKALTTLEPDEFQHLVKPFDRAFVRRRKMYKTTGKRRRKPASAVRLARPPKVLPTPEERLLFVLLGLKTDATQQHLALTFGMKQTTVSKWQRLLEAVLDATLTKLGHRPARTLDQLVAVLEAGRAERSGAGPRDERDERDGGGDGGASPSLHMNATTRRVPRSADPKAQRHDYSGKAYRHVVKNTVICTADQRVVYLGWSWRGAIHDKRIADEELPDLTALAHLDAWLTLDSGYLGYEPPGVHLLSAQRARRNHPLSEL